MRLTIEAPSTRSDGRGWLAGDPFSSLHPTYSGVSRFLLRSGIVSEFEPFRPHFAADVSSMPWKSLPEVEQFIDSSGRRDRVEAAYNLRVFAANAVYPIGYNVPPAIVEAIAPTRVGHSYLQLLQRSKPEIPPETALYALFGHFFHHDFLIDLDRSDLDAVRNVLNDEMMAGRIKYPYRFGRTIYDRFNNSVRHDRTDFLEHEEVAQLLSDTPHGVYQVGTLLSGPLGFLTSQEARFLPPNLLLPLWHCSDTGCSQLHYVTLRPPPIPLTRAYGELETILVREDGPESEWEGSVMRLHRHNRWPRGRPYFDLPALIGDSVFGDERTALVEAALAGSEGPFLRAVLGTPPRKRRTAEGTARQVAERLGEADQLQLLLLLSDQQLIHLLDRAAWSTGLTLPPQEVRTPKLSPPRLRSLDASAELSVFGVRAARPVPLASFVSSIWDSYEKRGVLDELGWRLTRRVGQPDRSTLADYLRQHDPAEAVRELILSSMPITLLMAEKLELELRQEDSVDALIERFLWKAGFNPSRYDGEYSRLRARLIQFNEVLLKTGIVRDEGDREAIRSVGVNLFVSVEHFLEQLIAFNTWLLASDHFGGTHFRYEPTQAVALVGSVLGSDVAVGDFRVAWNRDGGNTLGVLMQYLSRLSEWMSRLPDADRSQIARPEREFPHYAADPERPFPFRHTALWADSNTSELRRFVEGFNSISIQLARSNLAGIRNGLDHQRDAAGFPSVDEMLASVARMRDAFDLADVGRYIPKIYWMTRVTTDRYGRVEYQLEDYMGRSLTLHGPTLVRGNYVPQREAPVIVAPGNLLGQPNAELGFAPSAESPYSDYWKGYPRRRRIPAVAEVADTPTDAGA